MSHPNGEAVRAAYQAFSAGDIDGLAGFLAENCVWHIKATGALNGDYEGRDSILGFVGRLVEETGGTFKTDLHNVVADDDHVVSLVEVSATRQGNSVAGKQAGVFHLENGKNTEAWFLYEDGPTMSSIWD